MNERIKELAKEAGFNPYNYQGANAELFERFAELIVQDCVKQCKIQSTADGCARQIKKHFDIEQ